MNEKEIEKNTINSAEIVESSVDEKEIFNLNNEIIYHISDFDGPLDLLVTLIHDNEIDIEDLFISEITSQYVQIIKSTPREELDYDYAGEFIRTAAELLALKSARSLPRDDDEELDEDDPEYLRQQYILKVKEYALMKEQADKMRDIETINRFYREPEYDEHDYRIALVDFSLDKLIEAYAKICVQFDIAQRQKIPKKVERERFSVSDQMKHIDDIARVKRKFKFTSLFEPDFDKNDIVTTFLAVLELLRYQRLSAKQEEEFGEIILFYKENNQESPIEEAEEDY